MMMSPMNMMNMVMLHESDAEAGENLENASGETCSESGDTGDLICVMIRFVSALSYMSILFTYTLSL